MPFNLLFEPFAPFFLKSGRQCWLRVTELTAGIDGDDYAIEPAWPRPDFSIATYELLIGILSVAMAPSRDSEWQEKWRSPPPPEEIAAALAPLRPAFDLDGDGPRFLQEYGGLVGDPNPIEALLIDTPGANGQSKNADLLTRRGRYAALSLPAVAMALYTLQAYAPSGGAGNRTSMRGGGPLTALVIPQAGDNEPPIPLWYKVWANVALRRDPLPTLERIFPWLVPTQWSGKVHEADPRTHPLHAFFGMPRRLQLTFAESPARCAMTGLEGPVATGFVQKPWGIDYGIWQHPLTPYRRQKEGSESYSLKPKSGRFGYRDWVATTLGDGKSDKFGEPATNVATARAHRGHALARDRQVPDARVRVGGWAMNNMEAISYLVAETPLHLAGEGVQAAAIDALAVRLAEAGDLTNAALKSAVSAALDLSGEKGVLETVRGDFFARTDDEFHAVLDEAAHSGDVAGSARKWLASLRAAAFELFDIAAPIPIEDAERAVDIVRARSGLGLVLSGYGPMGGKLFAALQLPIPEKRRAKEEVR